MAFHIIPTKHKPPRTTTPKFYIILVSHPCHRALKNVAKYGKFFPYSDIPCDTKKPVFRFLRNTGFLDGRGDRIIPCHRVVNRNGQVAESFAFGGSNVQRELLEKEGVVFSSDGSIDLENMV